MMKKWFVTMMVCVLLVFSLAACAGKAEPKQSDAGDTKKAPAAKEEKVTLKLLQFKIEITDKVKAMAADYMVENPHVILDAQVSSDYDTLLKTRFASGDAPDIFFTKAFSEITDWSDKLADLSNEPWMSKVSPSALQGMTVEGKQLGFPVAFEGYGFIYNKDLFAKAAIDNVPTTLSELKEVN